MSIIAKPYTFSPNTTASSSQVNSNFDTLYNDYNGGVSAANLATDAVTTAKIADSNVSTAKIADDAVTDTKLDYPRWWQEIGRTTLGGTADTITVDNLPTRKYLLIIVNLINSGAISAVLRFNNDSGNNYAYRYSTNGAADTSASSTSSIFAEAGTYHLKDVFEVHNNVAANEKIVIGRLIGANTAGAGNIPGRTELGGKWANTSVVISRVDVINGGAGDFASGSEVIVLGHD